MRHFLDNILLYTVIPLFILALASSYYRFMIINDHTVSYEGYCDPSTESCFVLCDGDYDESGNCLGEEFYYTLMEKHAANLVAQCGDTIVDCEEANYCLQDEDECLVTYCDPDFDIDEESGESLCYSMLDNI